MKIYIAARYARRFELRVAALALKLLGHECTSQWLDDDEESKGQQAAALRDVHDVDRADCVIFLAEPYGSENRGGGRYFEYGYAFAKQKHIIVIQPGGKFETVFHALPGIEIYTDLAAALDQSSMLAPVANA